VSEWGWEKRKNEEVAQIEGEYPPIRWKREVANWAVLGVS